MTYVVASQNGSNTALAVPSLNDANTKSVEAGVGARCELYMYE